MENDVYICRPEDGVQSVAKEMAKRKISSVVVTDEQRKPLGIVTERDMVRKVVVENAQNISGRRISEIMTSDPVYLSPKDSLYDALSVLSRYAIKHLPIVHMDRVVGIVSLRQIMKIRYSEPLVIIGELEKAQSISDFKKIKDNLIYLTKEKLTSNNDPVDIVTMLSLINADIHKRLLQKAIKEYGSAPPADFCLFVTGSHGRKENLLFPDQDFCIIIDDYDDSDHLEFDKYFLEISLIFSDWLEKVGFPYCTGYIMGQNPTWRKRVSEWLTHISYLFEHQGEHTVRYMTLLFDSSFLYGNHTLFDKVSTHAYQEITKHHNILRQMHEEEGSHKVPLGWFSTFITEKGKFHKGEIDMKRSGLIFIIEAARILALKHVINETSTLMRLRTLAAKGIIHKDDSEYFENAYRVILHHTLNAQSENFLAKSTHDYFLKPRELSARNQEILKQAFKAISQLKDIVASELGELVL
jgi:CBS domain-containing protein